MKFKFGDRVHYHPVIGGESDGRTYVVSEVGMLRSGHHVAWLYEKSGCVGVEALSLADNPDLAAARLAGARAMQEAAAEACADELNARIVRALVPEDVVKEADRG